MLLYVPFFFVISMYVHLFVFLAIGQIAFSQPTREGQAFAARYTGGNLLVY